MARHKATPDGYDVHVGVSVGPIHYEVGTVLPTTAVTAKDLAWLLADGCISERAGGTAPGTAQGAEQGTPSSPDPAAGPLPSTTSPSEV